MVGAVEHHFVVLSCSGHNPHRTRLASCGNTPFAVRNSSVDVGNRLVTLRIGSVSFGNSTLRFGNSPVRCRDATFIRRNHFDHARLQRVFQRNRSADQIYRSVRGRNSPSQLSNRIARPSNRHEPQNPPLSRPLEIVIHRRRSCKGDGFITGRSTSPLDALGETRSAGRV